MTVLRNVFLVCLVFVSHAFAQQPLQQPVPKAKPTRREPAALAVLARAMAAMGVRNPGTIKTAQAAGAAAPVADSGYPSGQFIWTVEITGAGYEVRNQLTSAENVSVFASGHGSPKMAVNGVVKPFFAHMAQASPPLHFPFLLFAIALSNQKYTVTIGSTVQYGDSSISRVHLSDDTDGITQGLTAQDWYFDPNTGLPFRVEGRVPDPFNGIHSLTASKDFEKFQPFENILVPTQITSSLEGRKLSIASITSVEFNIAIAESDFDLTQGVN